MIPKLPFSKFYPWVLALLMLTLAKLYELVYPDFNHNEAKVTLQRIQKQINDFDLKFNAELTALGKIIVEDSPLQWRDNIDKIKKSGGLKYYLLICSNGELAYWSSANSVFDNNWCNSIEKTSYAIFNDQEQYYFGINKRFENSTGFDHVIAYTPLFPPTHLKEELIIHTLKTKKDQLKLVDPEGNDIGYLQYYGNHLSPRYGNMIIFYYLIVIFLFYYPFHNFAKEYFNKSNLSWAILCLFTGVLTTASMSQWIVHQHQFYHSILTDTLIQTNFYSYTLFEFIILCGFIFHLTFFFYKYYSIQNVKVPFWTTWIISWLNYVAILLALVLYCFIFKAIFVHSGFSFNLNNVFGLELKHYILLFALLLLLLSIFLLSNKLCLSTLSFGSNLQQRFVMYTLALLSITPVFWQVNLEIKAYIFILSSSIIIWMQDYFSEQFQKNILWLIAWIIVISLLTSGLIFHYQNINHQYEKREIIATFVASSTQKDSLAVTRLIDQTVGKGYDLYFFDHNILRYSSNINKPNYAFCIKRLGSKAEYTFREGNVEWYITKASDDNLIVITHPIQSSIRAISLFSYLFTLLILFSYFLSLLHSSYPILPSALQIHVTDRPSLRNRIQFYIILGIVMSFLIIAVVTVFFTKKSEQQILEQSLYSKTKNLSRFLETSLLDQDNSEYALIVLKSQLRQSSQTEDYFVKLFNVQGEEINFMDNRFAEIKKKRLVDPQFMFGYSSDMEDVYIQTNELGNHGTGITALKNIFFQNERIGIIQLQTISQESTSSNRLANLVNTLLNIYVFLFLIAASLATFLANSITSPLEVLANKIRAIRLGKTNEKLEWSGQDEIGELIHNYNSMVGQLDESALLLAKTERDLAWREMAKQVAHEIKNPLTPMKLSIQYLQQAIKSGSVDIIPMTKQVTETLIEQIENLTKIASEFSHFAKMPQAENEKLILNEIITSVHDLFRKREDIDISLFVPMDEIYIFADKNQLIRVLNNLINNAIQAIPENKRGKIDISLQSNSRIAKIGVMDNGIGIPEEMRAKVFLPNFTSKSSGTGLGLAMCQQIIESANGRIYFQTEVNVGTSFFVELPIMRN